MKLIFNLNRLGGFRKFSDSPQKLSSNIEHKVKAPKSLTHLRCDIDELVLEISSLQRKLNNIKATLTQHKIVKSKFDISRTRLTIEQMSNKTDALANYTIKGSIPPKKKAPKEISIENSKDVSSSQVD
jgi:hypothetical protein